MSPAEIGLIGFAFLLICIFLGVHIGFSLIVIGFLGSLAISGVTAALANASIVPFSQVSDANFAVIPLFMLMSEFIAAGGIGAEAYMTARAWVGHFKGGLAMASVGACGIFAAVSGSSMATAMVMGRMAYPEMKKYNYSDELASGMHLCRRLSRHHDTSQRPIYRYRYFNRSLHRQIVYGRHLARYNSSIILYYHYLYYVQNQTQSGTGRRSISR